jgi:hypothetical protein
VICARCLDQQTAGGGARRAGIRLFGRALQLAAGFFFLWIFFFLMGRLLLAVPSRFHEGTLWRAGAAAGEAAP